MAYEVKSGDTIYDAAFNVCGSLAGVDQLIEMNTPDDAPYLDIKAMADRDDLPGSNRMESYTPGLVIGEVLNTDGIPIQNLDAVTARDFNSSVIEPDAVNAEIRELVAILREPVEYLLAAEDGRLIVAENSTDDYSVFINVSPNGNNKS